MTPCLKLPDNFRVKTFFSNHNSRGVGEFLAITEESGAMAVLTAAPPIIAISLSIDEDITHVSKTCLCDSLADPMRFRSPSECTVVLPQSSPDGDVVSTQRGKKRTLGPTAFCAPKRKKVAPTTIMRRWQAV